MAAPLLLCTDMDRTIIPNGEAVEHPQARKALHAFCRRPEVTLVYVTGRDPQLVREAIAEFDLPQPDFAVTDVGTAIAKVTAQGWEKLDAWDDAIGADWAGHAPARLQRALTDLAELQPQEAAKQGLFKLSYYLPLQSDVATLQAQIEDRLAALDVLATVVWSIDEPRQIGLLDILPRSASKLHALEFLRRQLGYRREQLLFAGDSGNDLQVLSSAIPAVLVANASDEVRAQAQQLAESAGHATTLYLAVSAADGEGNYAAGLLQGVNHFFPDYPPLLRDEEV